MTEGDYPNPVEFTIDIAPHKRSGFKEGENTASDHTVYEIEVKDINGELLVFSNQGYENRAFAESLAIRLFNGRPARLNVFGADGTLDHFRYLGVASTA